MSASLPASELGLVARRARNGPDEIALGSRRDAGQNLGAFGSQRVRPVGAGASGQAQEGRNQPKEHSAGLATRHAWATIRRRGAKGAANSGESGPEIATATRRG
jgi:hypothetical protein